MTPLLRLTIRRLMAYLIDVVLAYALLVGIVQMFIGGLIGFPDWVQLAHSPLWLEGWILLSISLPTWLYFVVCDLHGGATVGKRLFGLKATTVVGGPIPAGQAILRTAIKLLPWELTHFSVLVPNPLWNPGSQAAPSQVIGVIAANGLILVYLIVLVILQGRRSIHDIAAGTMVTHPVGVT